MIQLQPSFVNPLDGQSAGSAKRIAIIMHDFSTGGSERVAIRLANAWAARGREVMVLCGTEAGRLRSLLSSQVVVITVYREVRRSPFSRVRLGFGLANLVEAVRPDVVFSPGNFHIPVLVVLAGALRGKAPPMVCKLSNPLRSEGFPRSLQAVADKVARWATTPIDTLVAMSNALAVEARKVLPRKSIITIHEPAFVRDAALPSPPLPAGPEIILCVGRLVHQKNFALALRAFAEMANCRGRRLVILGEGPQRGRLLRLARKLGIAHRVEIMGYVDDIQPYLDRAKVLLCTSRYEGYPAILIEALTAALPIVTTDCSPALNEIMIDRSFGRITAKDPYAIAHALEAVTLADRPNSGARAVLLRRHTIEEASQRYLELFDSVAAPRSRSRSVAIPPQHSAQLSAMSNVGIAAPQ